MVVPDLIGILRGQLSIDIDFSLSGGMGGYSD
jgi:hypothetical protein